MEYKWHSVFRNSQNKVSAMEVGFLIWLLCLSICFGYVTFKSSQLADIPMTVVHLTLALGATKVTHRLAEGNWEKILSSIIDIFKKPSKEI